MPRKKCLVSTNKAPRNCLNVYSKGRCPYANMWTTGGSITQPRLQCEYFAHIEKEISDQDAKESFFFATLRLGMRNLPSPQPGLAGAFM